MTQKAVTEYRKLNSAFIQSAEYHKGKQLLLLTFGSDSSTVFYDVPIDIYEGLIEADSHGKYYHAHIKGEYSTVNGKRAWIEAINS